MEKQSELSKETPQTIVSLFLGNFALAEQVITALMVLPAIVFKLTVPQDASGESTAKIKKLTIIRDWD